MAGSAVIGNLAVNLSLETAAFQNGATLAQKQAEALGRKMQAVGQKMTVGGAVLSAAITAPFLSLMSKAIPAAIESRDALAQVEAGLKSMGGASGKTSVELQKSADQLQRISLFDDDDILRKVTANLLTFGNVAGEQFDKAQLAIINMAARLNMDLQPATILVGKALNDPIKGLTAMGRAGIQFTDAQKEMIKGMVETGNVAGAQNIILKELERQFGGAAAAARKAAPGADMQEQWRTFQEVLGEMALKVLPPLTNFLTRILELFNGLSPSTQAWVAGAVALAAALGPVLLVLGPITMGLGAMLPLIVKLGPLFTALGPIILTFGKSLLALAIAGGPITVVILAAGALYLAFKNWDKIGPIVSSMVNAVRGYLADRLNAILDGVKARIDAVKNKFRDLYEAVVGHSYVPDMIAGIARSMAELGRIMVDPAISATDKVGAAFQGLANIVGDLFGHKAGSIISSLGNLAMALAPLFGGSKMFGSNPSAGAIGMASGGHGVFMGRGGTDRNLLSLNGSPIAKVSRGEPFSVGQGAGGAARVTVIPSPLFEVVVQGNAKAVAVPLAGQAALAGAAGAGLHAANAARRRIP